jgi:PP-loop superfamily ATP-utilizing enzyme
MRYFSPMASIERLASHLGALSGAVLGYSGGVDSAVLAVVGARALGPARFLAVIGRSASRSTPTSWPIRSTSRTR